MDTSLQKWILHCSSDHLTTEVNTSLLKCTHHFHLATRERCTMCPPESTSQSSPLMHHMTNKCCCSNSLSKIFNTQLVYSNLTDVFIDRHNFKIDVETDLKSSRDNIFSFIPIHSVISQFKWICQTLEYRKNCEHLNE